MDGEHRVHSRRLVEVVKVADRIEKCKSVLCPVRGFVTKSESQTKRTGIGKEQHPIDVGDVVDVRAFLFLQSPANVSSDVS